MHFLGVGAHKLKTCRPDGFCGYVVFALEFAMVCLCLLCCLLFLICHRLCLLSALSLYNVCRYKVCRYNVFNAVIM